MKGLRTIHSLKTLLLLAAVLVTACQSEEISLIPEDAKTGRIVLSLPEVELYTEGTTRTETNASIADFNYTLNGSEGSTTISFSTDGSAIISAGTYTLTATSKNAADAAPWYQGTSASFTIGEGQTKSVSISLGKPKNAEVNVTFAEDFTTLYDNYSVTIGNHTLKANGKLYAMPGAKVLYTIKGSAKQGSHVTDIPAEGISGTINAEAGNSYPINITAAAISELLINMGNGEHNGEFDTKEYHPLN